MESGFDSDKPVVECCSTYCEIELSGPIDAISSSREMDDIGLSGWRRRKRRRLNSRGISPTNPIGMVFRHSPQLKSHHNLTLYRNQSFSSYILNGSYKYVTILAIGLI